VPPGKITGFSTSMRYVSVSMIETEITPLKKKFKAGDFTKKAFNAMSPKFQFSGNRESRGLSAQFIGKAILAQ